MVKPEWGFKRLCQSCGARYYDFLRTPIVCPSCGTTFDSEAVLKSRRARPLPVDDPKPKARKKVEEVDAEEEDVEEIEDDEDEDELDDEDAVVADVLDDEEEDEEVDPAAKRLPAVDLDDDDDDEVVVDDDDEDDDLAVVVEDDDLDIDPDKVDR